MVFEKRSRSDENQRVLDIGYALFGPRLHFTIVKSTTNLPQSFWKS